MTPALAHLFLVRTDLNHENVWRRYFAENEAASTVYVHAKSPGKIASEWLRGRLIAKHCPTEYGHVSLVEAELLLLEAALAEKRNQFFLLHSESCVPIRRFEVAYRRILESGRTWLKYFQQDSERHARVDPKVIPREHFYKSSQFFCLSRAHAELLLDRPQLEPWAMSWNVDEHYIPTMLSLRGELANCHPAHVTYSDWHPDRRSSPSSPAVFHRLSPGELGRLREAGALFARKFAPDSDIAEHIAMLHGV